MKLLLGIKDEKAGFVMELLQSLPFVKAKTLSPYKTEVFEGIQEAVDEMRLIKAGKLKVRPAKELFNEL